MRGSVSSMEGNELNILSDPVQAWQHNRKDIRKFLREKTGMVTGTSDKK